MDLSSFYSFTLKNEDPSSSIPSQYEPTGLILKLSYVKHIVGPEPAGLRITGMKAFATIEKWLTNAGPPELTKVELLPASGDRFYRPPHPVDPRASWYVCTLQLEVEAQTAEGVTLRHVWKTAPKRTPITHAASVWLATVGDEHPWRLVIPGTMTPPISLDATRRLMFVNWSNAPLRCTGSSLEFGTSDGPLEFGTATIRWVNPELLAGKYTPAIYRLAKPTDRGAFMVFRFNGAASIVPLVGQYTHEQPDVVIEQRPGDRYVSLRERCIGSPLQFRMFKPSEVTLTIRNDSPSPFEFETSLALRVTTPGNDPDFAKLEFKASIAIQGAGRDGAYALQPGAVAQLRLGPAYEKGHAFVLIRSGTRVHMVIPIEVVD